MLSFDGWIVMSNKCADEPMYEITFQSWVNSYNDQLHGTYNISNTQGLMLEFSDVLSLH